MADKLFYNAVVCVPLFSDSGLKCVCLGKAFRRPVKKSNIRTINLGKKIRIFTLIAVFSSL